MSDCLYVSEVLLCPGTQLTWLARAKTTFQFLGLISGNGRDYCKDNPYFHLNYIYFEPKLHYPTRPCQKIFGEVKSAGLEREVAVLSTSKRKCLIELN